LKIFSLLLLLELTGMEEIASSEASTFAASESLDV
jgi:hypothetical protein